MIINLKINSLKDRENMVIGLASAGYKVWVEEVHDTYKITPDYYIHFDDGVPESRKFLSNDDKGTESKKGVNAILVSDEERLLPHACDVKLHKMGEE